MPNDSHVGSTSASGSRHHSEYSLWSAATGCTACARRIDGTPASEKAEVVDLACADQVLDRAGHVLDRHVRVDPVLVEQVDAVGLEPLERGVGDLPDPLRPAVHARLGIPVLEAELGGDHYLVAERRQGLAHQLLVGEGAIGFGGVEERHSVLERVSDQRDRILFFQSGAIGEVQSHAAEAQGRNFEATVTEFALLHFRSPSNSDAVNLAGLNWFDNPLEFT
jgi:hypothetical protein